MKIIYIITPILLLIVVAISRKMFDLWNNIIKRDEVTRILIRQCARWAIASEQDETPLIKLLHANYSTGYLWAVKDVATDDEISRATGIDMKKFTRTILKIQDESTMYAVKKCSVFGPKETYLLNIANSTI